MKGVLGRGRPLRHDAYSHRATSPALRVRRADLSSPVTGEVAAKPTEGASPPHQSINVVNSPSMLVHTPKSSSRPETVRPAFTLTSYWT